MKQTHLNALSEESSPYLRQHARNPVHWLPWGKAALEKARTEDKLLIVSIGYSSCHWCHVMEHESFEDGEVAELMNRHFVSIKIDREERPDIDQVYMGAVHLMGQQGGWPLNCIALPDGRPIWGGTYFPREQWMSILKQVHNYYLEKRQDAVKIAERLEDGIRQNSMFIPPAHNALVQKQEIRESLEHWSENFDTEEGGFGHAPKFPIPANLAFLLHQGYLEKDRELLNFVELTLVKMARGGIYDQAGGGFARYSVDRHWKAPHFEKMLYDNGQLLGLYAEAFQVFRREEFREVLEQSLAFLKREMRSPEGLLYSALDADSEGVEGLFYTWTREELQEILGGDFELFAEYYQVNERGLWENGRYILLRGEDSGDFARARGMDTALMEGKVREWQELLLEVRKQRIRPGLDDKALCSWNALAISGLVLMYRATGHTEALELALEVAGAMERLMADEGGRLFRNYAGGKASIPAFHIDYSLSMQASLDLYEVSMDMRWLDRAGKLAELCDELFWDHRAGMYLFNSRDSEVLITSQVESQDNVMPSSNSVMAHNLFRLGQMLGRQEYLDRSSGMLAAMRDRLLKYPGGFAHWGRLALMNLHPFHEIVVSGPDAAALLRELAADYLPQALLAGSSVESGLPLFQGRFRKDKTHIFVCRDRSCELPVEMAEDARKLYQR